MLLSAPTAWFTTVSMNSVFCTLLLRKLPQEQLFELIGKVSFIHFMKILPLEITEILLTLHETFVLPAFCWQASEKT